jgi:hypothetical protein
MALSKEAFIEAAWDVVGRKVSKERLLADIYETAQTSIGLSLLPVDAPAIRMFQMVIAEARSLIRQRNEIERMAMTCSAIALTIRLCVVSLASVPSSRAPFE